MEASREGKILSLAGARVCSWNDQQYIHGYSESCGKEERNAFLFNVWGVRVASAHSRASDEKSLRAVYGFWYKQRVQGAVSELRNDFGWKVDSATSRKLSLQRSMCAVRRARRTLRITHMIDVWDISGAIALFEGHDNDDSPCSINSISRNQPRFLSTSLEPFFSEKMDFAAFSIFEWKRCKGMETPWVMRKLIRQGNAIRAQLIPVDLVGGLFGSKSDLFFFWGEKMIDNRIV